MESNVLDLRELRLRVAPWIALFLGVILVIWALLAKRAALSWSDLYPGVAAIAAGLLLFGFLKYIDRRPGSDEPPTSNDESDVT